MAITRSYLFNSKLNKHFREEYAKITDKITFSCYRKATISYDFCLAFNKLLVSVSLRCLAGCIYNCF